MYLVTGSTGNVGREAEYVDAFFGFYVGGALDESRVLPTVRDITGRESGTFAAWAKRHAPDFAA